MEVKELDHPIKPTYQESLHKEHYIDSEGWIVGNVRTLFGNSFVSMYLTSSQRTRPYTGFFCYDVAMTSYGSYRIAPESKNILFNVQ